MDKTLMKTVGRSELAPITHGISDVPPGPTTGRRNYSISLHAESIRPGALVLLFGVDVEIAFGCRLRGHADRNGGRHQAAITFHHVDVLLGKRNFHTHGRRIMWLIRGDVVRTARAHPSSCCTTSQQQHRAGGTQQNQSVNMSHTWILDKVGWLFVNRAYPWMGRRLDGRSPRRTLLQPRAEPGRRSR